MDRAEAHGADRCRATLKLELTGNASGDAAKVAARRPEIEVRQIAGLHVLEPCTGATADEADRVHSKAENQILIAGAGPSLPPVRAAVARTLAEFNAR